jgi:hypothetical protein
LSETQGSQRLETLETMDTMDTMEIIDDDNTVDFERGRSCQLATKQNQKA